MNLNKLKKLKEPYVIILIGTPLAGKSYFCKKFIEEVDDNVQVISNDDIVMEVYASRYGGDSNDYSAARKTVSQAIVNKELNRKFTQANKDKRNVIIDMTHMYSKRRRWNLSFFDDDYYKLGILFPVLSEDEYKRRNMKRKNEDNKFIPYHVIDNMISSYETIREEEEGFDKVIDYK